MSRALDALQHAQDAEGEALRELAAEAVAIAKQRVHRPRLPQPVRIPSDDCMVEVDGINYFPHEGQAVWLLPGLDSSDIDALYEIQRIQVANEATDDINETVRLTKELCDKMRAWLAERIDSWDWKDLRGKALPPLDGTTEPLRKLRIEELGWLIGAVRGRSELQRKNGLRPSATTSSATQLMVTTKPAGGRNRSKGSSPTSVNVSPALPPTS